MEPTTYVMDNEASKDLKGALRDAEIKYQLIPLHNHKTDISERAIHTCKEHFKVRWISLDPYFPISKWDILVEQSELTLNLLRVSRANPKLSAFTYFFGEFNYSVTPLIPPGTKILTHLKLVVRTS